MKLLLIFLFCLTVSKIVNAEIDENLIKLFPAFPENDNDPRICTGIALNQNHFLTTEVCAAQTSRFIYVHVLTAGSTKPKLTEVWHNYEFTVGGNNDIVVGKMPKLSSSSKIKLFKIQSSNTVLPGESTYTLIGFKNVKGNESFEAEVTIQDSERCKNEKFSTNKYFVFNETTEICAEITVADNLSTFHYGSGVFDKALNNIIGLLSIMEEEKNVEKKPVKVLAVLTKLSAFCGYISSGSNFKCS